MSTRSVQYVLLFLIQPLILTGFKFTELRVLTLAARFYALLDTTSNTSVYHSSQQSWDGSGNEAGMDLGMRLHNVYVYTILYKYIFTSCNTQCNPIPEKDSTTRGTPH